MTDDVQDAERAAGRAVPEPDRPEVAGERSDDGDGFAEWFDTEFGAPEGVAPDATEDPASAVATLERPPDVDESAPHTDEADERPLIDRAAARVLRRPIGWWTSPWTSERMVRVLVTSTALVTTTVVMMLVVHFNPLVLIPGVDGGRDLIFDDTTPTGGDMGAHVWGPAFLRDHFLPAGQISGWTMDWYGGLPLYRFYMVIPALAIVAVDAIPFVSYGVAFKIVAMSGLITFPAACWAFGRLAAFRHPIPELFAFGGLCFLLDESFEIYGGNVKSTMAGEFSFSIALTLAVLGLGLLANGLRTGRFRVWTAVVLSLAAVSHGIVLIFVAVAATVLCLVWLDGKRLVYAVTTGITTILLSAWWVGPFLFGHEFMTDMKYGFRPNSSTDSFWDMYFPLTPALDILVTSLAVIGFAAMILRRQLTGTALGLICVLFAVLVWNTRDSLPVIGLLWNPRLLPFFYLTRYLLMVIGALELITWVINAMRAHRANRSLDTYESAGAFGLIGLSILLVFGWMYETLPFDGTTVETEGEAAVYSWGPFRKGAESGRAVADGWTRYNWTGYEGRPAYPAYYDLVTTMEGIGDERGCGRALWENNSANSEYGTTMALMLLPHWTDGCISSMEGLFFEATASTNYHFITAAAVSESSSNPVRQLRYVNNDADLGVRHMRDLGVSYLMVRTDAAKGEAATAEGLTFITTSGTWDIYAVDGSNIVEPLTVEPVVVSHADGVERYHDGDQRERNLELGTSWFQRPQDWPALPVDEGPEEWQRVSAEIVVDERVNPFDDQSRKVDYVEPVTDFVPTPLPEAVVSNVEIRQQSVSFEVDRVGVPVLVKVSYFPNWEVSGAQGPYRAGANHMIVVPTSSEVTLSYDSRSTLDLFFYLLTAIGIGLCFLWQRQGDIEYASEVPSFGGGRGDSGDTGDATDVVGWADPTGTAEHDAELPDGIADVPPDPTPVHLPVDPFDDRPPPEPEGVDDRSPPQRATGDGSTDTT